MKQTTSLNVFSRDQQRNMYTLFWFKILTYLSLMYEVYCILLDDQLLDQRADELSESIKTTYSFLQASLGINLNQQQMLFFVTKNAYKLSIVRHVFLLFLLVITVNPRRFFLSKVLRCVIFFEMAIIGQTLGQRCSGVQISHNLTRLSPEKADSEDLIQRLVSFGIVLAILKLKQFADGLQRIKSRRKLVEQEWKEQIMVQFREETGVEDLKTNFQVKSSNSDQNSKANSQSNGKV